MEATIRREKLIIPTYGQGAAEELPLFSDLRINQGTRGYIYPYRMSDKLTMVKEDKAYDAIRLENDFIRQFFRFLRAVVYILDSQFPGVLGGKQGLQPGCGFRENRVAGGDHGIISHGDDPVQRRHTLVVYVIPHGFSHEKEPGSGVVDDVVDRVGFELVEDGNGHGPVSECGKEDYSPVGRVAAA